MPFGILNQTDAEPLFSPLVTSSLLSDSIHGFEVWETLGRIGHVAQVLENIYVFEGLRGLHLSRDEASARVIQDGQTVDVYIATYDNVPGTHPISPKRFMIQVVAHVHEGPLVEGDPVVGKDDALPNRSSPILGLCDILLLFDIVHEEQLIEADDEGHLDVWHKNQIKGSDVIIRKKAAVRRKCF